MLTRLRDWVKSASSKTESGSDRDGFLSYHAESHAAGVGIGIGWIAVVTGDIQLLGLLLPAITSGLKAKDKEFGKILTDVKTEPHYALGGIVFGALLGLPFGALPAFL